MTRQGTTVVKHENRPFSNLWKGLDFLSPCSKVEKSHLKMVKYELVFQLFHSVFFVNLKAPTSTFILSSEISKQNVARTFLVGF